MEKMAAWLETVIAITDHGKNKSVKFILVLIVLGIGAASLYILLNSPA